MTNNFLIVIYFILALGTLIFLHELGHFLTSKLFKIEVEEFGFGLPPRLFRLFKIGETDFTINALPFGAFVRPKGENDPDVPGGLASASPWKRLIVLLGGPIVNLVTGILLFSFIFSRSGVPEKSIVQIIEVVPDTPAAQAGLLAGDQIQKINDITVTDMNMLIQNVSKQAGNEILLLVNRNGQQIEIRTTPRVNPPAGQGSLGIILSNPIRPINSWFETVPYAFQTAFDQISQVLSIPGQLIRGQIEPEQARVVGPKGMFDIFKANIVRDNENSNSTNPVDTLNTFALIAVISIALGFTNLLPLPALDGGRILFLIPELITRKRVPARFENLVHGIGMMLLLGLMVYITIKDFIDPINIP